VALTFDARGGVYIAGGISPRIIEFMRQSQFRARFEAKGRFREYLKTVPVNVITHPAAAFLGLTSISPLRVDRDLLGYSSVRRML
jgi:glucokinase